MRLDSNGLVFKREDSSSTDKDPLPFNRSATFEIVSAGASDAGIIAEKRARPAQS